MHLILMAKLMENGKNAMRYELNYEIDPALNGKSNLKTTALVQYDNEYLYIGFQSLWRSAKTLGELLDQEIQDSTRICSPNS